MADVNMTIAHFSITADYANHPIEDWLARHGVAVALAGCVMFWITVGTVCYFAL